MCLKTELSKFSVDCNCQFASIACFMRNDWDNLPKNELIELLAKQVGEKRENSLSLSAFQAARDSIHDSISSRGLEELFAHLSCENFGFVDHKWALIFYGASLQGLTMPPSTQSAQLKKKSNQTPGKILFKNNLIKQVEVPEIIETDEKETATNDLNITSKPRTEISEEPPVKPLTEIHFGYKAYIYRADITQQPYKFTCISLMGDESTKLCKEEQIQPLQQLRYIPYDLMILMNCKYLQSMPYLGTSFGNWKQEINRCGSFCLPKHQND